MKIHTPVLVREVLESLAPKSNENFVDGTCGEGGHTAEILRMTGPNGKVLGIDADSRQVESAKAHLVEYKERVLIINDSYSNVREIVNANHFGEVNGMLLDLGYSSYHIDASKKGFSFQKDEALDMRYGSGDLTATTIINEWPEAKLEQIFEEYGEEKFATRIAKEIGKHRRVKKIHTTNELLEVIKDAIPSSAQRGRIHYATRVFQALRIAVNNELSVLEKALPVALSVLAPGGRLVVISFHSLEDRMVKNFFKQEEQKKIITIVTKKPVVASEGEIALNPRSRSAKLRAIIKA